MAAPGGIPIYAASARPSLSIMRMDLETLYGHIRNGGTTVSKGDPLKVDAKITEVGTTGNSAGNDLTLK